MTLAEIALRQAELELEDLLEPPSEADVEAAQDAVDMGVALFGRVGRVRGQGVVAVCRVTGLRRAEPDSGWGVRRLVRVRRSASVMAHQVSGAMPSARKRSKTV